MNIVRVGVGGLVELDNKLLLLQRSGSHGAGKWALPGGHQEFGETPEDTAVREVREETGLEVRAVERLGYTDDAMLDEGKHYITLYVRCELVSGEARVMEPEKATDIGWFSEDELSRLDLFSPLQTFLERDAKSKH